MHTPRPLHSPPGSRSGRALLRLALTAAAVACLPLAPGAQDDPEATPALRDPLADYATPTARLVELAELADAHPELLTLSALPGTESMEAAPTLATLAIHDDAQHTAPVEGRPAVLVVGGLDAGYPLSSELAQRLIRHVVENAATDETLAHRLRTTTLYVVPTLDQAGSVAIHNQSVRAARHAASAPIDEDRDGLTDEDPGDDLNGDGVITLMRIADPTGRWREHPDDPRVMYEARADEREAGGWIVVGEGRDDDGDERFNEDGNDGVILARQWPLGRDWNDPHSGIYPIRRAESKALTDFLLSHPNIAMVVALGPNDTLADPTKGKDYNGRDPMEDWDKDDAAYLAAMSKEWRDAIGAKKDAKFEVGDGVSGSLGQFAYEARGRFAISMGVWSLSMHQALAAKDEQAADDDGDEVETPQPESDEAAPSDDAADSSDAVSEETDVAEEEEEPTPAHEHDHGDEAEAGAADAAETPEPDKKPESADVSKEAKKRAELLEWLDEHAPGSSIAWTAVEHPDFAGRTVEVGGVVPYADVAPPAALVEDLLNHQAAFLAGLADHLPRVALVESVVTQSAPGVFEVELTLRNDGGLPTVLRQGERTNSVMPVWVSFGTDDENVVTGNRRNRLPSLAPGETAIVRAIIAADAGGELAIDIRSDVAGQADYSLTLPASGATDAVRRTHAATTEEAR